MWKDRKSGKEAKESEGGKESVSSCSTRDLVSY